MTTYYIQIQVDVNSIVAFNKKKIFFHNIGLNLSLLKPFLQFYSNLVHIDNAATQNYLFVVG